MSNAKPMNLGWAATFLSLLISACGVGSESDLQAAATNESASALGAGAAVYSGRLTVSSDTISVGTPITVTESATNLTSNPVGPLIIGIRRPGFEVTAADKPSTGLCRIAGSATCNFVLLGPNDTQSYVLTLVPAAPGTFTISGWTTSSYVGGGSSESVTVTVQ